MKIIKIKIEEFGCLADKCYDILDGLNLAVGENESGKSTLLAFIKFIFYGLPKKTLETAAERDRSFSWKSNTASGSLTFSDENGDVYTVYRRSVRKKGEKRETLTEDVRIIDERSGIEVHKDESPADLFLGIPASVFESTSFVRQSGVTDVNSDDVGSALENILISADESLNLDKALDRLDSARKLLLHKKGGGGLLPELEAERNDLSLRLDKAKANYERILSITEHAEKLRREALDKRRELDKLDDLSAAVAKAEAVKRFDLLREKEKELASLRARLEEFLKTEGGEDGFIPDAAYVASLRAAISSYENARNEYSMSLTVLREVEAMLERENSDTEKICPLTPVEIRSRGGADMICDNLNENIITADKKKKSGKTLFTVLGILLTAAVALTVASFILPLTVLLFAGIGAAAVAILLALLGAKAIRAAKKLINDVDIEISALGAPSNGASFEKRIALIRTNLLLCIEKEARINDLESRCGSVRSVSSLREKDLEAAKESVLTIANKWRSLPDDNISFVKAALIDGATAVIARLEELNRAILTLKGQADTLAQSLEGMNENDLRARVSPVAMKIYESGNEVEIEKRRKYTSEAHRLMNEKAYQAEKELLRLEHETEDPARLAVLLEENQKRYAREKLRLDAIMMAHEALSEASGDIRSSISPVIRAKAEGYMAAITDQKYSNMGIDENYSVSARSDEGGVRSVELLSAGTRDSAYLSLRLALLEVIFKDEKPFLALDEALAQLDDKRAAAALRMLAAYCRQGGQCILFTCHTREEALLKDIAEANIIRL